MRNGGRVYRVRFSLVFFNKKGLYFLLDCYIIFLYIYLGSAKCPVLRHSIDKPNNRSVSNVKDFLQKSRNKRKVLVVDDELINRELLDAILSQNYEVTCAANCSDAMSVLRSAETSFSLILLDILMPGKSGIQFLADCKADEQLKDIPVIMMTSEKSAELRSIRLGADDFISKPYRMPEVIIARCERVIEHNEEKALIRSIERDPDTGMYIELFFMAYVRRLLANSSKDIDAVAITVKAGKNREHIVKETARIINRIQKKSKGISCVADDSTILICCVHREDHEAVLGEIKAELINDLRCADAELGLGIIPHINGEKPVEGWFESARNAALA